MIAGLHWTAWVLVIVSVGLGLIVELTFYFRYRANRTAVASEQSE